MHVALLHTNVGGPAGGGGSVRQMLELGLALHDLGHRVTVACHDHLPGTEFGNAGDVLEIRAVRRGVVTTPTGQRATSRRQLLGMRAVADLVPADADVVNSHEWPALHGGHLAGRRLGIPHVWTRNDDTMWERGANPTETIIRLERARTRIPHMLLGLPDFVDGHRADRVLVLDHRNARMVRKAYLRDADVVRSGPAAHFFDPPDRDQARARLGLEPGDFLVLAAAILFPHRRFEDLIEAMALAPDATALILGSDHADRPYADMLDGLIDARGLRDRVRLPRAVFSEEDLRDAYAAADVFVFPNRRQTWGLAPLEALAAGTPVIVSRGAGVHEVLEGRPGVALVDPEDPPGIAAAIEAVRAAGRPDVEATREWIRAELSNRRYAERCAEIFAQAIAARR